jgi:hypothetical protein
MQLKTLIPSPSAVVREGLIVLGGLIIARIVLSKIPALNDYVNGAGNSQKLF